MTDWTPIDVQQVRDITPGVHNGAFFNNAGASLMTRPTLEAMHGHIALEGQVGGYAAAEMRTRQLDALYGYIAKLINAAPDEIAITDSAQTAWQKAFYAQRFSEGDRIITTKAEYGGNYVAYLQAQRRHGVEIVVVPNDESGALNVAELKRLLDERVKLVSITWIPTNGGLVNPAAEVGRVARDAGAPVLLDACQAVGQMPVDVEELQCDMLVATGRKFLRGPRGTGFLYMRRELVLRTEPAAIDHLAAPWVSEDSYELRPDARRFETWENNYAAHMGLAEAVQYAMFIGLDRIQRRAWGLADRLRGGLNAIPRVGVRDLGHVQCAIVSFSIEGIDAEDVVEAAREEAITIETSSPMSTRLDAESRSLPVIVRAAPHYFNTDEEVDQLVELIAKLAR